MHTYTYIYIHINIPLENALPTQVLIVYMNIYVHTYIYTYMHAFVPSCQTKVRREVGGWGRVPFPRIS